MKIGKLILIGGGAWALYKIAGIGQTALTAEKLNIAPTGVKWQGIKSGAVNFDIVYTVVNPSNGNLTVNSLFADVFLPNGSKITSINKSNWNQTVYKESTNNISVPIRIYWTELLSLSKELLNSLKTGKMPKELQIKGFIKVNKLSIEFDELVKVI